MCLTEVGRQERARILEEVFEALEGTKDNTGLLARLGLVKRVRIPGIAAPVLLIVGAAGAAQHIEEGGPGAALEELLDVYGIAFAWSVVSSTTGVKTPCETLHPGDEARKVEEFLSQVLELAYRDVSKGRVMFQRFYPDGSPVERKWWVTEEVRERALERLSWQDPLGSSPDSPSPEWVPSTGPR